MIYSDCNIQELKALLKKNREALEEIEYKKRQLDIGEEISVEMLQKDCKALEHLRMGWTGEDAEKYISFSLEANEFFQTRFCGVFSEEKKRMYSELREMKINEQDILDAVNRWREGE